MIKIENEEVIGWEAAIRGMRNPMNSWEKSDSFFCKKGDCINCEVNDDCGAKQLDFDIGDRKSTRLNSSHSRKSRMPSSA